MNATTALARLEMFVQSAIEPTLSGGELDVLLSLAAIVDEDGYEPQDDDWTPTYSPNLLNLAIAQGWNVKAGKLGAGETGSSDGATFNPEVRRQFCLDQEMKYRNKVSGSFLTAGRTGRYDVILGATETVL